MVFVYDTDTFVFLCTVPVLFWSLFTVWVFVLCVYIICIVVLCFSKCIVVLCVFYQYYFGA